MKPEVALPHSQVPTTCPYLSQLNPVHIPTSHFLKIHLNIILPSMPGSQTMFHRTLVFRGQLSGILRIHVLHYSADKFALH